MIGAMQLALSELASPLGLPANIVPLRLPHPIPYQGSKRSLAPTILSLVRGRHFRTLYEPFAGSAAFTIAAVNVGLADQYIISDSLAPLAEIWRRVVTDPASLADAYERIWWIEAAGTGSASEHYNAVRDEFNRSGDPAMLLYLLARCVKNAPRWNQSGKFNQSPDLRRLGMHPNKMRLEIMGASALLGGRVNVFAADFQTATSNATADDLLYLDPPYMGVSKGNDKRYYQSISRERLITELQGYIERGIAFILSYDGRSGEKTYGSPLPESLGLHRLEINVGRSSQATLNGRSISTVESLYLSPNLF